MQYIIRNVDTIAHTYAGQTIEPAEQYAIQTIELDRWRSCDNLLSDIGSEKAIVNDGSEDIVGVSAQIEYLLGRHVEVTNLNRLPTFTSKTIDDKSLFKRATGIRQNLSSGSNTFYFSIPFNWVKITGAAVVGGEVGDYASFYVLDSSTGTYTGIPNYQLNQFAYDVNIAKDWFTCMSSFDADLYVGMQIKIVYNSVSEKQIGVNFIMDEVK